MFTLKLYQNGDPNRSGDTPAAMTARTVILEVAGIWVDACEGGVSYVQAFKKKVGVMDEDGPLDFYVGGSPTESQTSSKDTPAGRLPPCIVLGYGGNHFAWGVLENAMGKTTEMLR